MTQEPTAEYNISGKQKMWAMVAIFAVYGTMAYFFQTLTIARPKIAAALNGMELYAWAVSIPSLIGAFVTLIFGKFSDIYGRRIMLLVSLSFCLAGSVMSAFSTTFEFLIFASVVNVLGTGAMMPLVFAVVGDVFPPSERGKWIGLLNIPIGFFALIGPPMGGWVFDNLGWRYLFWIPLPLLILCLVTVPIGVPSLIQKGVSRKIDIRGCLLVAVASSTTILGFSFAGTTYPWASVQVIGLLAVSLVSWICFFKAETGIEGPILDPVLFRNRSFLTISIANTLSFFGQMAMVMYFPVFLQGVLGISTTISGWITVPFGVLMSFTGVPIGFLLARSKRYKWLYVAGFAVLTLDMFAIVFFTAETHFVWCIVAAVVAGVSLGAVPVVNTLVIQNVMPRRLLGSAMGAMSFCLMMSVAISSAVLGSTMTASYDNALASSIPEGLTKTADAAMMAAAKDQNVLLSETAMADLEKSFDRMGPEGKSLFPQTIEAIRNALMSGLRSVFLLGAIAMLLAFLLISTIPEVSLDSGDSTGTP